MHSYTEVYWSEHCYEGVYTRALWSLACLASASYAGSRCFPIASLSARPSPLGSRLFFTDGQLQEPWTELLFGIFGPGDPNFVFEVYRSYFQMLIGTLYACVCYSDCLSNVHFSSTSRVRSCDHGWAAGVGATRARSSASSATRRASASSVRCVTSVSEL